jgi:hypothetical protein
MWEKYGKFILKFENMITQHFFIPFLLNQDLEGARLDGANLLGAIR